MFQTIKLKTTLINAANKIILQHKKINRQYKNKEKVPHLEVAEVVLVQCDLEDNQYQQKSEVLYLLQPINLMLLVKYF